MPLVLLDNRVDVFGLEKSETDIEKLDQKRRAGLLAILVVGFE